MTNSTEKQEVCMTFGKIFTESSLIFLQLHGQQINVEKPKVKDFYWILDKQHLITANYANEMEEYFCPRDQSMASLC